MVDCNKGYNIERENIDYLTEPYEMITYNCLSTDDTEMKVRYLLKTKIVK